MLINLGPRALAWRDWNLSASTRVLARPNDLDALGHVNHAVLLEYLDAGRWEWLRSVGAGSTVGAILAVVTRIEVDYVREVRLGEWRVRTQLVGPCRDPTFKVEFRQSIEPFGSTSAGAFVKGRVSVAFIERSTRLLRTFEDFLTREE